MTVNRKRQHSSDLAGKIFRLIESSVFAKFENGNEQYSVNGLYVDILLDRLRKLFGEKPTRTFVRTEFEIKDSSSPNRRIRGTGNKDFAFLIFKNGIFEKGKLLFALVAESAFVENRNRLLTGNAMFGK